MHINVGLLIRFEDEVSQVSFLVHEHLLLGVEGTVRAACRGRRGPLVPGVGTVLGRPWNSNENDVACSRIVHSHRFV